MGKPIDLPQSERAAALTAQLLEAHERVVRADTLFALARYLHAKGEHQAAELLRTELDVFRFMRKEPREQEREAA